MGGSSTGDEAYELLADLEGVDSGDAAVAYVRGQRRLRGEPSMSRGEAVRRAQQHLREEGLSWVIDEPLSQPQGSHDLWILWCHDPEAEEETAATGLVVSAAGDVGRLERLTQTIDAVTPPDTKET